MRRIFLVAMLLLVSNSAFASGACKELPPVEDFACNTQVTFSVCKMEVELGLLKGSSPEEAFSCIDKNKNEIKTIYKAAKEALKHKRDATEALKGLYSYWLSSMDALIPGSDERKIDYKRKLSERELGLNDRANRLKIEAE